MPDEPETEVILCPACKHMLRVPFDWLGTQVQCPECKAMFRAPSRDGTGGLTEAVLISRPDSQQPAVRKSMDTMLLLPAFGLMLCGVVGTLVNAREAYVAIADPAAAKEGMRQRLQVLRQAGVGKDETEADRDRLDAERAAEGVRAMQWAMPVFTVVAALAFLGGLSIVLRWNYRLAQLGSVAAALNFPGGCCLPGAVVGAWALLMLSSDEARAHFGK